VGWLDKPLLKTMPGINPLFQFINVMNLVDLLLHFSSSVSSMTQTMIGEEVGV